MSTASRSLAIRGGIVAFTVFPVAVLAGASAHFLWTFAALIVGLIPVLWLSASLFALQAIDLTRWNSVRAVQVPVYAGLLCGLWLTNTISPPLAALAATASNIVCGLIAFRVVSAKVSGTPLTHATVVSRRALHRFAWPNLAWTIPTIISGRIDQIALSLLVPTREFGIYVVASTLTTVTTPIVASIGNVLMPMLSRQASVGADGDAVRWRRILLSSFGFATAIAVAIAFGLQIAVDAVFGVEFEEAKEIVWLLVPSTVLYATKWVAADLLRGRGDPASAAVAEWVGVALSCMVVPIAAAAYGAAGAALALVCGATVSLAIACARLASRRQLVR